MSNKYMEDRVSSKESVGIKDGDKPGVLLIGDSIKCGYADFAKEFLQDVADVRFTKDNCQFAQHTFVYLRSIVSQFENDESVNVVVWNNGHWDIAHWNGDEFSLTPIEEYKSLLVRIYKALKGYFPNAKIVFMTTSPVNPDGSQGNNPRTRPEIESYNKAAIEALGEYGVLIDDAYEFLKDEPSSLYADYCHLTEDGFKKLGKHVADFVRELL